MGGGLGVDVDRQGWPEGEIELRAVAAGHYLGRDMMTPAPGSIPRPLASRLVAVDLAGRAAAVIERAQGLAATG
ncbi:hypothetical protein [Streptomyces sp. NPDC048659]|uniref:hypothetical protein n=1 Tax=Streptomyces sp. NPDC048659 TaxID=3155489 RepID=UPI00341BCA4F